MYDDTRYSDTETGIGLHGASFDGVIDEVALYDRALSTAEIQSHAAGCSATPAGNANPTSTTMDQDKVVTATFSEDPTAVSLLFFTASVQADHILLAWATAIEIDNLGFNVYRASAPQGTRIRLNASLIPTQAPGSAVGADYAFVDRAVEPGLAYYYWLEDVDVEGTATLHGPVSAGTLAHRLLPLRPRLLPGSPILRER